MNPHYKTVNEEFKGLVKKYQDYIALDHFTDGHISYDIVKDGNQEICLIRDGNNIVSIVFGHLTRIPPSHGSNLYEILPFENKEIFFIAHNLFDFAQIGSKHKRYAHNGKTLPLKRFNELKTKCLLKEKMVDNFSSNTTN